MKTTQSGKIELDIRDIAQVLGLPVPYPPAEKSQALDSSVNPGSVEGGSTSLAEKMIPAKDKDKDKDKLILQRTLRSNKSNESSCLFRS